MTREELVARAVEAVIASMQYMDMTLEEIVKEAEAASDADLLAYLEGVE